jgi:hypothetical protein
MLGQKGLCVGVSLLFFFVCSLASEIMLGGASPASIDDHTNEVASWAVTELNGKANVPKSGDLEFVKVISAKKQVVQGLNHMLTLEAKDGSGKSTTFEVTVWEKPAFNQPTNKAPMELTHFKVVESPVGEGNQEWEAPAQQLVAQLNQRSNSLFPYVLKGVLVAAPANDGDHVDLTVSVKRGDKEEVFNLKGHKEADNHYSLLEVHAAPQAA